ncbi:hypothetical protein F441_18182 [Phytophthora nicotianae CJ01A1]|uniref:Uncharacterized protein n=3 Tax=Phytophthora nicotianae TaxID=4792 RepID=V9E111_PHYNI|nr:hypothetical protein F443_20595 [Phytophthora nicotianae P1569]ETL29026.1 hypothetical protein L916_17729 [Phytophthora nicotianae]ETL79669.1 hypothetical protein L917_19752 [Phytophthora nicotianae]ETP05172.1 hypothetical protein F441_18182 [Phytophthora nicotianae CJ01A1]
MHVSRTEHNQLSQTMPHIGNSVASTKLVVRWHTSSRLNNDVSIVVSEPCGF